MEDLLLAKNDFWAWFEVEATVLRSVRNLWRYELPSDPGDKNEK